MSYKVRTDNFEGPFDLLLYLVSRDKVDIGSISLSEITDQYLAEMRGIAHVDLDVASDFLLVASTLLEIKAASLIPQGGDDLEEIDDLTPGEALEVLVARLLKYKKYKNVAAMLEGRAAAQARMHARTFGPDQDLLGAMPDFLAGVSLESLAARAARAYGRRDVVLLESEHIAAKPIPVETYVRALHARIRDGKRANFSELLEDGVQTPVVVVTFLAILELYKRGMVRLSQDREFGDIAIEYIEGSGDLVFGEGDRDYA